MEAERHDNIREPLRSIVNLICKPSDAMRNTLVRQELKARARRFSQEPMTGFGDVGEMTAEQIADFFVRAK